jgi:hypothetical protein
MQESKSLGFKFFKWHIVLIKKFNGEIKMFVYKR